MHRLKIQNFWTLAQHAAGNRYTALKRRWLYLMSPSCLDTAQHAREHRQTALIFEAGLNAASFIHGSYTGTTMDSALPQMDLPAGAAGVCQLPCSAPQGVTRPQVCLSQAHLLADCLWHHSVGAGCHPANTKNANFPANSMSRHVTIDNPEKREPSIAALASCKGAIGLP